MQPRELVYRTLAFDGPERVPRQLWTLPWAGIHHAEALAEIRRRFPDDIVSAPSFLRTPLRTQGDAYEPGRYVDEWGCVFENRQRGVIGEVKEPLLKEWGDLDVVRPPLEALTVDVAAVNSFCRATDRFVLAGCCPRPFERMQFIRRTENLYIDLAERSPGLMQLIDRVHQFYMEELALWVTTEVDGVMFMDDWGAQRSLLISPAAWRALFKPLYRDYIELAHRHGKPIFMHSDGYTLDIIPDLIELGLDAINAQIFCIGVETLGERFRGKITFWGEIDRQHLLPHGTPQEIVDAVRSVHTYLWDSGGAIAQCEFGAGANPENVALVFQTWDELSAGHGR
ncbi:MAG: methyltransferase [Anaerolineales bacterium]|nr:methyltransferase [Anaerolineales bacterium]